MIIVIVPIVLLLSIILIKKIPYIGGNIQVGLMLTGLVALLMGGIFNPIDWLLAWVDGVDRIAWVIGLVLFGSLYAETQVKMGTMDTIIKVLRAMFGHSPKGLIACVVFALVLAGSLLGDAIAASTVIGVLVIKSLAEMKMSGEQICCTIVMGAALGSIMPPITQAIFMSSALLEIEPDPVVNMGYITVGIGVVICTFYVAQRFIKIKSLPEELIPKETAGQLLRKRWATLVPLMILVALIVLRTGFKIDLLTMTMEPFITWLAGIKILKGASNLIVLAIIVVTIISFFYPLVRNNASQVFKDGLKNVKGSLGVLFSAGLMLGAFYAAGQIEAVKTFAMEINQTLMKVGGGGALVLIGMLTGSQTTAQNTIFSFFGPALVQVGVEPLHAAIAGSHLAMSGQGLPPADLTTFVVAGLVGGILGIKVDPIKSMLLNLPMCLYFLFIGFLFMFI